MNVWAAQIEPLARTFRIIRYDTRGHGQSDVLAGATSLDRLGADVIDLADALGLESFSFCGLSLGGMTAQWLGWRAPQRIDKLIIANSSPFMGPPSSWQTRIDTVLEHGMEAVGAAVIERWFTPEFRSDHTRVASILEMLLATQPAGYAACSAAIRDTDMRPCLELIRCPTLVIGGLKDPATPVEHSRALANGIAGAECEMLDAAHLSNIEQASAFTSALTGFLAR